MFNSMRIRTKLVVALLIPLIALASLSWVAIGAASQAADDADQRADEAAQRANDIEAQVDMARASIGPKGAVSAIQNERNNVGVTLIGLSAAMDADSSSAGLQASYDTTDQGVADFRKTLAKASPAVQKAYAPVLEAMDGLEAIREEERTFTGDRDTVGGIEISVRLFDKYSAIINTIFDVNGQVALGLDDPELRSGARFIDQMSRYSDREAILIKTVLFPVILPGANDQSFFNDRISHRLAVGLVELNRDARHELETTGTPYYQNLAREHFEQEVPTFARELFEGGIEGEPIDLAATLSQETSDAVVSHEDTRDEAVERLGTDGDKLVAAARAESNAARAESDDAASEAQQVTIATAIVMVLAVAITLVASRSIAKPLGRLVGDAEAMANESLPGTVQAILDTPLGEDVVLPELHKVEASGGYEISELADALNTVQSSAADLAAEQAILRRNISDSFVNLGRRNQNLLSRQLDSITEMERNETDPAALEQLFTLDHLATRMRRNAESLLLLAGLEPHRQWSAPIKLIDVLRGALGEVEDYNRVEITRLDDVTVKGSTAADLTHLIAELLENALNFSPPGRNVTISGAARDHGYMLAIVDNGIGMEADDLAQANVRLAGGESFTVAPSRYLGHYVVGIQASRLGVKVTLQETPGGGITAMVDLSEALATEEDVRAATTPPVSTQSSNGSKAATSDTQAEKAPAEKAPVQEPAVPVAASTRAEAADFGAEEPTASAYGQDAEGATTASGYKKRVRGQNVPRTDVVTARGDSRPEVPSGDVEPESKADSMRSMLSGLQSGADRARAEVDAADPEEQK